MSLGTTNVVEVKVVHRQTKFEWYYKYFSVCNKIGKLDSYTHAVMKRCANSLVMEMNEDTIFRKPSH